MPSLIGWLSLCLLAAAWGKGLDDHSQYVWSRLGAFGLIAAVGLGSLEGARATRARWAQVRELRSRLATRMAKATEENATIESINAGIRKLRQHAAEMHYRIAPANRAARHLPVSVLADLPLEVTTVNDEIEDLGAGEKISGSLRHLSTHAVAFEHHAPFVTQVVLLDFQLSRRERLAFVVDVIWTEVNKDGDGFTSGGTVLAVGVPERRPEDDLGSADLDEYASSY